jgi:signal transduction histidine kinase
MSTQFSDFVSAHSPRVAQLWATQTRSAPGKGDASGGRDASQFVNAVLVAMTADDLRPLITLYRLAEPAGLEDRLNTALLHMQAVQRVTDEAAIEQGMDDGGRLALALASNDELGDVMRQLATGCAATLGGQLASASSASSARGTSLSITMHELRRPLTILNSYGQLLSTGMLGTLPESATVAIEGITASTEMMVRMVSALAELSRLEDPDDRMSLEVIDAAELVTAAVEQVNMEAKLRGTTIEPTTAGGVRIKGDRRRLVLALTNLLGNAVKHGPPDSTIAVSVRQDGGFVHFAVRDHGAGFPPEDAPHLFDKYFRSVAERQRKVAGSGLGLYIVRTVAERHQGSVTARNVEGNGAEFEMILPIHHATKER